MKLINIPCRCSSGVGVECRRKGRNGILREGFTTQRSVLMLTSRTMASSESPIQDEVIYGKDGKPLDIPNVVGIYPIRSGFSLVQVDDQGKYIEQGFKYGRKGPQPFG